MHIYEYLFPIIVNAPENIRPIKRIWLVGTEINNTKALSNSVSNLKIKCIAILRQYLYVYTVQHTHITHTHKIYEL